MTLIRAQLDLNTEGGAYISSMLNQAEELFLFKDCQQYWSELVPRARCTLSHNDIIGPNVLRSLNSQDPRMLVLIDMEMANWNPEYYDLATFLSESQLDHSNLKYYFQNKPSDEDVRALTQMYLDQKRSDAQTDDCKVASIETIEEAVSDVKKCMQLHSLFIVLASIWLIPEENFANPDAFQWPLIQGRFTMQRLL